MLDKKLTNNEIIKALEQWIKNYDGSFVNFKILANALDLITCQQEEIENLKVENQSLRGAANSLKMHYEKAQANIERLKKYDEERDIRLHARLIANTKSETAKEILEDLKKYMHNKFKDLDEYEFEYITERDIDSFLKMVGE